LHQKTSQIEQWALALVEYVFCKTDFFSHHTIQFGSKGLTLHLPANHLITTEIMNSLVKGEVSISDFELIFWECSDPSEILNATKITTPMIPGGQHLLSEQTTICRDQHMDGLYILDRLHKRILIWVPSYESFPYWAKATPFRIPFSWVASENNGEMIHSAAIELEGHGVLLAGNSGRGKTTTALNGALEGARILGEDFILYMNNRVFAVYTTAKIHPGAHLDHLIVKGLKVPPSIANQKSIVSLRDQLFSMVESFKPTILYFPRILEVGSPTEIVKVPKALALREFAGPSFIGLQGAGAHSFTQHSNVVRTLDTWSLPMTGQLDQDLALLQRHLQSEIKVEV
jgi:hypothetical protein